ncbi:Transmembrane protein 33 [Taenia solium]|eukprot:TsM_000635900 transcript=TsM_000635900 gene=TsM_000635900
MASVESNQSIRAFLTSNWSNTLMYITRLVTIFSCLFYFLGSLFGNTYSWYQRALIANAATFALRLHQRIAQRGNQPRLSQESVQLIVSEDSLHYLLYSVIFLLTPPVTVALAPIFCFASLHCLGFTQNLLALYIGKTENPPMWARRSCDIVSKAQSHGDSILRIIAIHEILLMVISIVLAFSSRIPLLPFFYYHFLKLRYASHRNPYCRIIMNQPSSDWSSSSLSPSNSSTFRAGASQINQDKSYVLHSLYVRLNLDKTEMDSDYLAAKRGASKESDSLFRSSPKRVKLLNFNSNSDKASLLLDQPTIESRSIAYNVPVALPDSDNATPLKKRENQERTSSCVVKPCNLHEGRIHGSTMPFCALTGGSYSKITDLLTEPINKLPIDSQVDGKLNNSNDAQLSSNTTPLNQSPNFLSFDDARSEVGECLSDEYLDDAMEIMSRNLKEIYATMPALSPVYVVNPSLEANVPIISGDHFSPDETSSTISAPSFSNGGCVTGAAMTPPSSNLPCPSPVSCPPRGFGLYHSQPSDPNTQWPSQATVPSSSAVVDDSPNGAPPAVVTTMLNTLTHHDAATPKISFITQGSPQRQGSCSQMDAQQQNVPQMNGTSQRPSELAYSAISQQLYDAPTPTWPSNAGCYQPIGQSRRFEGGMSASGVFQAAASATAPPYNPVDH